MVSVCTGLLEEEGRVSASVDQDYKPNTFSFYIDRSDRNLTDIRSFYSIANPNLHPERSFFLYKQRYID